MGEVVAPPPERNPEQKVLFHGEAREDPAALGAQADPLARPVVGGCPGDHLPVEPDTALTGRTWPLTVAASVDLPDPFAPSTLTMSVRRTARLTSRSATREP